MDIKLSWYLQQNAQEVNVQFTQILVQECIGGILHNVLHMVRKWARKQGLQKYQAGKIQKNVTSLPFSSSTFLRMTNVTFLFPAEFSFPANESLNHSNSAWWPACRKSYLDLGASSHCTLYYVSTSVSFISFIIEGYFYFCVYNPSIFNLFV